MSATLEAPHTTKRPRFTRDQAADRLVEMLTEDPQSETVLRRRLLGTNTKAGENDVVHNGLMVLEARTEAKRIPDARTGRDGWVRFDSRHEAVLANPQAVEFPYDFKILKLDEMFIDKVYQRPLTTFVNRIIARFDPVLFQTLALSDRGTKSKPKRYAVIDGQTRWVAAGKIGIIEAPATVYRGLTIEDEADIFARLQSERRGMVSWHRFRAALAAKKPEALAIQKIVKAAGYTLGDGEGQLKAVGALESCYRKDEFFLEQTLAVLKEAWPKEIPEGTHIRGLHFFFRRYPIGQHKRQVVDGERLVRRLSAAGSEGLKRKSNAAKEAGDGRGSSEKWMGVAIQNVYQAGGRS